MLDPTLKLALDRGEPTFAWWDRGQLRLGGGRVRTFSGEPGTGPWAGWPGPPPGPLVAPVVEDAATWQARVAGAEAACRAGLFEKVVPARVARHVAPPGHRFDPGLTLAALATHHPEAIAFLVGAGSRWFLGASPEILARVEGGHLRTHALAGTRARPADPAELAAAGRALLASEKDRREHDAVVADLVERLTPLVLRLSVAPAPRLRVLPGLLHLETPIGGPLRPEVAVDDVVAALHPTPALGGRPREAALAWLAAHEPFDRGGYGAPLGFVTSEKDGVFCVAIRSALVTPDEAWAFAGAGVVAGTDPAAEWAETEAKLRTITAALQVVPR